MSKKWVWVSLNAARAAEHLIYPARAGRPRARRACDGTEVGGLDWLPVERVRLAGLSLACPLCGCMAAELRTGSPQAERGLFDAKG